MDNEERKSLLKQVKTEIKEGNHQQAFSILKDIADKWDDFGLQTKYSVRMNAIDKSALNLKKIRLAILPTSTTTHLSDVLKFWAAKQGFDLEIYEAEFDTINQMVLDPTSDLYKFKPEIVIIFTNYRDIKYNLPFGSPAEAVDTAVQMSVDNITMLWNTLQSNMDCYIIQNNVDLPDFRVFGNYEGSVLWSNINLLRQINIKLAESVRPGVTILDMDYLSSFYGKRHWCDKRFWYHSKHSFTFDASGFVASEIANMIASIKGLAKKCLVVDLDNTMWGGVIGDDGVDGIVIGHSAAGEAFVDFQKYLLKLKERGIILTVCSKNEENLAKEPFEKHPDMVLKLSDFAMFKANWDNKADNIKEIAETLNIGLDSIVFIDDNPVERGLVRKFLPMVSVPELPQDPSYYIPAVNNCSLFETISFSSEDSQRTDYYKANAERSNFAKKTTSLSEYLENLQMESVVGQFDQINMPRIVQLINKSNQFHLTTTRYTEAEIKKMMEDENKYGLYFRLKDCFGDNGLISVLILEKQQNVFYIDTWVMSCRVLSRGMEEFICNELISLGRELQCDTLLGKYIPTPKNNLVAELYPRLGFNQIKDEDGTTLWELDLSEKTELKEVFINKKEG